MEVLQTTDYDMFEFVEGNRKLNPRHVRGLRKAIEKDNLLFANPILVDSRMRVLDGQHRLEVARGLGVPIFYLKVDGLEPSVIPGINTVRKGWTTPDYINYYAELGSSPYVALKTIMNLTSLFPSSVFEAGELNSGIIRRGELDLNPGKARMLLDRIEKLQEYVDIDKSLGSARMMRAFIRLMKAGMYNHDRMVKKLEFRAGKIRQFSAVEDNMRELEEVYNYFEREKVRIF